MINSLKLSLLSPVILFLSFIFQASALKCKQIVASAENSDPIFFLRSMLVHRCDSSLSVKVTHSFVKVTHMSTIVAFQLFIKKSNTKIFCSYSCCVQQAPSVYPNFTLFPKQISACSCPKQPRANRFFLPAHTVIE